MGEYLTKYPVYTTSGEKIRSYNIDNRNIEDIMTDAMTKGRGNDTCFCAGDLMELVILKDGTIYGKASADSEWFPAAKAYLREKKVFENDMDYYGYILRGGNAIIQTNPTSGTRICQVFLPQQVTPELLKWIRKIITFEVDGRGFFSRITLIQGKKEKNLSNLAEIDELRDKINKGLISGLASDLAKGLKSSDVQETLNSFLGLERETQDPDSAKTKP